MNRRHRAPAPPGALGVAAEPAALLTYLSGLDTWLDARRADLDRLDTAARESGADGVTADVVLALTLWQAVRTRADDLAAVWDSGRADAVARERMSQLIWGRLGGDPTTSLLSLVDAARLCDAQSDQLAARLSFDPHAADVAARLRALSAGIVRAEDRARVTADTTDDADVARLRDRMTRLTADAARGADITGPLDALEQEVARTEGDLIVAVARGQALAKDRERAVELRTALADRAPGLNQVAERCRREIVDPPVLAVPDVTRLGDVPDERDRLATYVKRLGAVERAMKRVEDAYTAPLRERAELRYRVGNLMTKAHDNGRAASATVTAGESEAREAIDATPCDLAMARHFTEQLETLVRDLPKGQR